MAAAQTQAQTQAPASAFGLQGLGASQRDLLDLLDTIQFAQITHTIPQIAVVGDQSAGKSSLLTSLTGIVFPRLNTACTRCATEIRLRRAAVGRMKLWIQPDEERPENEKRALQGFCQETEHGTPDEIARFLQEAAQRIAPTSTAAAGNGRGGGRGGNVFASKDKIVIEKSGPNLPLLTLVDLPGLVRIANTQHTAEDLRIIDALTDAYMHDPNTIILAVVSGNIDYVQAPILEKAVAADPKGTRTIGVLTKPDMTESQAYTDHYIRLMTRQDANSQFHFKLGWYVVLNPGPGSEPTLEERRQAEKAFWRGKWLRVPAENRGSDALREQLGKELQKAIARSIPAIQMQIREAEEKVEAELASLGVGLDTPQKVVRELSRLFGISNSLVDQAVNGPYRNPPGEHFFSDEKDDKGTPPRNLRAKVVEESERFERRFRQIGRKLSFVTSIDKENNVVVDVKAKREFAKREVEPLLPQIRGRDLPGDQNSRAPYMIFRSHCKQWPELAQDYQRKIETACKAFLIELVEYTYPTRMQNQLHVRFIKKKFDTMITAARAELARITYEQFEIQPFDPEYQLTLAKAAVAYKDKPMTEAEKVVEQMLAYYRVAERVFIRNVIYQVAERHLLLGMATMFGPTELHEMDSQTISDIAAEDTETQEKRAALNARKEKIQEARDKCDRIALRRDFRAETEAGGYSDTNCGARDESDNSSDSGYGDSIHNVTVGYDFRPLTRATVTNANSQNENPTGVTASPEEGPSDGVGDGQGYLEEREDQEEREEEQRERERRQETEQRAERARREQEAREIEQRERQQQRQQLEEEAHRREEARLREEAEREQERQRIIEERHREQQRQEQQRQEQEREQKREQERRKREREEERLRVLEEERRLDQQRKQDEMLKARQEEERRQREREEEQRQRQREEEARLADEKRQAEIQRRLQAEQKQRAEREAEAALRRQRLKEEEEKEEARLAELYRQEEKQRQLDLERARLQMKKDEEVYQQWQQEQQQQQQFSAYNPGVKSYLQPHPHEDDPTRNLPGGFPADSHDPNAVYFSGDEPGLSSISTAQWQQYPQGAFASPSPSSSPSTSTSAPMMNPGQGQRYSQSRDQDRRSSRGSGSGPGSGSRRDDAHKKKSLISKLTGSRR